MKIISRTLCITFFFFNLLYPIHVFSVNGFGDEKQVFTNRIPDDRNKLQEELNLISKTLGDNPEESEKKLLGLLVKADSLQFKAIRYNTLEQLKKLYLKNKEFLKAKPIILETLKYSEEFKDYKRSISDRIEYAQVQFQLKKTDSTLLLLEKAEFYALKFNYPDDLAIIYNSQAKIYDMLGQFDRAINLYFKSVKRYEDQGDLKNKAIIYHNIGDVFISLKKYQKAIEYTKKAETINKKEGFIEELGRNYTNLGVSYKNLDSLSLSLYYNQRSLEIDKKLNPEYELAADYLNLGNNLVHLKRYDQAMAYFDSSLFICKKYDIGYGKLFNQINIGGLYNLQGEYAKAISILEKTKTEIQNYQIPRQEVLLYHHLSKSYEKSKEFQKALDYYQKYHKLKDSIAEATNNQKIAEITSQYEKEKTDLEIAEIQTQVLYDKTQGQMYLITLVLILLIISVASTFIMLKWKEYKAKENATKEKQKQLLSSMDLKDRQLVNKDFTMDQLRTLFNELEPQIANLISPLEYPKAKELGFLVKRLHKALNDEDNSDFNTRFDLVNYEFYQKISGKYPTLTASELRLCGLLRMNISTKEIAQISKRSLQTINNGRSSIRKKLQLKTKESLTVFLTQF